MAFLSRSGVRVTCFVLAVLTVVVATASCTSSKHATPPGGQSSSTAATRWWSNAAVTLGSAIDPASPTAAAAKLHESRTDYCGMLKQTLDAGKSILSSNNAKDPKLVLGGEAFVAEIEKVAPSSVSSAWHTLGPVILALLNSGGSIPSASTTESSNNLQAAEAINADSKQNCNNLDLSSIVSGG